MNRFIVIDLKQNEILYLNRVDYFFTENEKYTGSEKYTSKEEMLTDLKKDIDYLENENYFI